MSLQNHDAVKRIKHVRRPKKKAAERLRRQKEQKKRLLALGFPQEVADKMNPPRNPHEGRPPQAGPSRTRPRRRKGGGRRGVGALDPIHAGAPPRAPGFEQEKPDMRASRRMPGFGAD